MPRNLLAPDLMRRAVSSSASRRLPVRTITTRDEPADVVLLFRNTVFNGNQPAGTDSTFDQMMATRFPDTNLAFSDEILAKAASYSDGFGAKKHAKHEAKRTKTTHGGA